MKVNVFIERLNKNEVIEASNIEEILSKLGINQETVLIARDNKLVTKKAELKDKDNIKLLSVVSGG